MEKSWPVVAGSSPVIPANLLNPHKTNTLQTHNTFTLKHLVANALQTLLNYSVFSKNIGSVAWIFRREIRKKY